MATIRSASPLLGSRDLFGDARKRNAPLAALVVGMLVLTATALVGLAVDPRIITGTPA